MNKKTLVVEIVIILATIFMGIWILGIAFRPADVGVAMDIIEAFHLQDENSFDVIGYGSSHMLKGFDTHLLNEEYDIHAYNYGDLWQQLNTTLLFIEDSLRTQKPKIAIIDTYRVDDVIVDQDMDGEVYYTRAISNFEGRKNYLKQCFGDSFARYVSYYVPFVAFHENWYKADFGRLFERSEDAISVAGEYGFGNGDGIKSQILPVDAFKPQMELPENSRIVLDRIVDVCRENDIQIIFCTIPFAEEYKYGDAMTEYAKENDCIYVNYFDKMEELGISFETDFVDSGHVNINGADKITKDLVTYIEKCK